MLAHRSLRGVAIASFDARQDLPMVMEDVRGLPRLRQISCGDAPVFPGDVLVGDGDGVMVIPAHLAEEVAEECSGMEMFEEFVLAEVKDGSSIIGLYPCTKDENQKKYDRWRAKKRGDSGE